MDWQMKISCSIYGISINGKIITCKIIFETIKFKKENDKVNYFAQKLNRFLLQLKLKFSVFLFCLLFVSTCPTSGG